MKLSFLILLIFMNCLWAASLSIYKALAVWLPPGGVVTLRFSIATVCLAVLWPWLPGKTPRGWDFVKSAFMGLVVFMLGHRIQVYGTQHSTAGDTSVLMGVEPLLTSVAAAIFLREHIGPRRWIGFALAMFGVALLNGFLGAGFQWAGLTVSFIFMSSFLCETTYSIMCKPLVERASVTKILAIALFAGTAANVCIDGRATWAVARHLPLEGWLEVSYLGLICTAFGYAIWSYAIREGDVNVAALTIFAQPVAGVAIAAVWLHEPLHRGQFWGCGAILAGLGLGLSRQIKTGSAKPDPDLPVAAAQAGEGASLSGGTKLSRARLAISNPVDSHF